ncbi:hypothetical protein PF007_g30457 [Phytophthora fragariae]|uniref:Uncharacterized protein n=2 Tax=Phytophthora fragariae TaxID=53985 RepID=A0A6A3PT61_9STRA|nr:hypothetical protein PF011_g30284 [Phytophthora fragariae]KAE9060853.1 hypothetical protein PF007_g30457 [Phytophthora fragariae]KAE9265305.1 hypothetical protein PF001_g30949 [Phytophthora fragariae]
MRYHKGFWVYAGEEGASISESAGHFEREQATLPVPGDSKAAGNWLRSRAGRTLRDRWLACTPDTRQMYMNNNPDESFPLADNPEGIADARRERSRYPRMVPADVTTPRVLQEAVATTPRPNASPTDRTTRKQLDAVQKYCAVVECMGANIANGISPPAKSRVVEIATDVAHTMRAAATQMTMYTDQEAPDALQETV